MAALAMPLGYAASPFLEVVHFTGGNQAYVIPGGRIARVRTCVSIISANFTGGVHSYITLKPHDDSQQFDVTGIDPGTAATITMYYIYSTEVGASSLVANSGTVAYTSYNPLPLVTLFWRNDDGGAAYGKDSHLTFDPPADGEYQVRVSDARGEGGPQHAYRLTLRRPRPDFSVEQQRPLLPDVIKGLAGPQDILSLTDDDVSLEIDLKGELLRLRQLTAEILGTGRVGP